MTKLVFILNHAFLSYIHLLGSLPNFYDIQILIITSLSFDPSSVNNIWRHLIKKIIINLLILILIPLDTFIYLCLYSSMLHFFDFLLELFTFDLPSVIIFEFSQIFLFDWCWSCVSFVPFGFLIFVLRVELLQIFDKIHLLI